MRRLALIAPLAWACSSSPHEPSRSSPSLAGDAVRASSFYVAIPLPDGRTPLAKPQRSPRFTSIIPIAREESVLFVSQFAGHPLTYIKRVVADLEAPALPTFVLAGEVLVGAARFAEGIVYLTTRGREVCAYRERERELVPLKCAAVDGDMVIPNEEGWTVVSALADEPDAPPPKKKQKKGRPKPKKKEEPVAKPKPRKMGLQLSSFSSDLVPGEVLTSDLTFRSPMPGLDLIAAATGRNGRTRLAFYEIAEGATKPTNAAAIGRAFVSIASLESDAMLDLSSRHALTTSDLLYGSLATHESPRFVTSERGILYIDQSGFRGRCGAVVASPFYMPMIPDQDACAVDPDRYFDLGVAARENLPAPPKISLAPELKGARRSYGQPQTDPVRVAGFGARKFTRIGDDAFVVSRGAAQRLSAFPLIDEDVRVLHAAFTPDGEALIHTDVGLATFAPKSALDSSVTFMPSLSPRGLGEQDRRDTLSARAFAARVGGNWFQSRGDTRTGNSDRERSCRCSRARRRRSLRHVD
jgi:hypothetical protein